MRKMMIIQEDDGSLTTEVETKNMGIIKHAGYRAICDITDDLKEYFGMEE